MGGGGGGSWPYTKMRRKQLNPELRWKAAFGDISKRGRILLMKGESSPGGGGGSQGGSGIKKHIPSLMLLKYLPAAAGGN